METLRGELRYGRLGKRESADFVLFVVNKPALVIVSQTDEPLPPEHLIACVNLPVEVQGTTVGDRFHLVSMRRLRSAPFPNEFTPVEFVQGKVLHPNTQE